MLKKYCSEYNLKTRSHPSCCLTKAIHYCKISKCNLHFCDGCFGRHSSKHDPLPDVTTPRGIVNGTLASGTSSINNSVSTTSMSSISSLQPPPQVSRPSNSQGNIKRRSNFKHMSINTMQLENETRTTRQAAR